MTLHDFGRLLREHWLVVITGLLLGVGSAIGYCYLKPPEYTAKLTMYVSSQGADTTQAAFQGAQLSQDRVASYTELLTGPRVTSDVIRKLGLPETSDELARRVSATSKLDSVLLDVSVTDLSADRATTIANTIGDVFPDLVAELERSTTPGVQPAVAVRVVQPAFRPTQPSSASLPTVVALGIGAGLLLGICLALARNSFDVRVKSVQHLGELTGAANLGIIPFESDVAQHPLKVFEDPRAPVSEAFRQLRTNLQFVDVDHPRKTVVVTSALPSEGKTTTLVNLALAMASTGSRVLAIEADLRRPKLCDLLGLDRSVGLTSILSSGRTGPEQAIQSWGGGLFDVLASGPLPPNPSELLGSQHMKYLLGQLRGSYDYILIDSPPLLPVTDSAALAPLTDGVILICRHKKTKFAQIGLAVNALNAVSSKLLGTVFTMVAGQQSRSYGQLDYYAAADGRHSDPSRTAMPAELPAPADRARRHGMASPTPTAAWTPVDLRDRPADPSLNWSGGG